MYIYIYIYIGRVYVCVSAARFAARTAKSPLSVATTLRIVSMCRACSSFSNPVYVFGNLAQHRDDSKVPPAGQLVLEQSIEGVEGL